MHPRHGLVESLYHAAVFGCIGSRRIFVVVVEYALGHRVDIGVENETVEKRADIIDADGRIDRDLRLLVFVSFDDLEEERAVLLRPFYRPLVYGIVHDHPGFPGRGVRHHFVQLHGHDRRNVGAQRVLAFIASRVGGTVGSVSEARRHVDRYDLSLSHLLEGGQLPLRE